MEKEYGRIGDSEKIIDFVYQIERNGFSKIREANSSVAVANLEYSIKAMSMLLSGMTNKSYAVDILEQARMSILEKSEE